MPDLWRISPEILSVEPTSLLNLEILPANDVSTSELVSLEKELPHYQLLRGPMRNVTHGSVQLGRSICMGPPSFNRLENSTHSD